MGISMRCEKCETGTMNAERIFGFGQAFGPKYPKEVWVHRCSDSDCGWGFKATTYGNGERKITEFRSWS